MYYNVNKKDMRKLCAELNIEVTEGATKNELLQKLKDYYIAAAAVNDGEGGYDFVRTDRPIYEYSFEFQMTGYISVWSEDKDVAERFAEDELKTCWNPHLPFYKVDAETDMVDIFPCESD